MGSGRVPEVRRASSGPSIDAISADLATTYTTVFSEGATEVSITGTTTLTSTAFGKMHVCSGTTADYTVTLPAVSGNADKHIGLRMTTGLTKLVTIDGNGAETIDGSASRVMWAQESAILRCDGSTWSKVAGKAVPMVAALALNSNQSIPDAAATKVTLNRLVTDRSGLMADATNNKITVKRPGLYNVSSSLLYNNGAAVQRAIAQVWLDGAQLFAGEASAYNTDVYPNPSPTLPAELVATDELELYAYHGTGAARIVYGSGTVNYTTLTVAEVLSW